MNRTMMTGAGLLLALLAMPTAQAGPLEDLGDRVFDLTDCFVFGPCNTDPADRDRDRVPDGIEPALCRIEDKGSSADGTCNKAGTNYQPPRP